MQRGEIRELKVIDKLVFQSLESRANSASYVGFKIKMKPRGCRTLNKILLYILEVDIHVEAIFLDVCRGCWLISSLSLNILEENNLCLLVLSNPLEVFSESDRLSILGQLEERREYSTVNVKLIHE